jgi:hypothetical protein
MSANSNAQLEVTELSVLIISHPGRSNSRYTLDWFRRGDDRKYLQNVFSKNPIRQGDKSFPSHRLFFRRTSVNGINSLYEIHALSYS